MRKSRRSRRARSRDHRIFSHTARKSKKINISPRIFRGGIRL